MFAFPPPLPDRALNFQREIRDFLSFLLKIFPYFPFSLVKRITWEYSASSIFWMIIYGPGIQGICSLCLVKTMARRGKENVTQIFQPPRLSALFVHPCGHRLSAFFSCGTNLSGTRGRDTDVSGWGGPCLSREHWGSTKKAVVTASSWGLLSLYCELGTVTGSFRPACFLLSQCWVMCPSLLRRT